MTVRRAKKKKACLRSEIKRGEDGHKDGGQTQRTLSKEGKKDSTRNPAIIHCTRGKRKGRVTSREKGVIKNDFFAAGGGEGEIDSPCRLGSCEMPDSGRDFRVQW